MHLNTSIIALSFLLPTSLLIGQPYGIPLPREANNDLVITELPGTEEEPTSFPLKLSDLPALLAAGSGQGHTVLGVLPYEPAGKLWSDNAEKERYLALPGLAQLSLTEDGEYVFPEGSITVKNFILPTDERDPEGSLKRLETRIMVRLNDQWHGYSYEWNEEGTDATLLPPVGKERSVPITLLDGSTLDYNWDYPSRTECFICHTQVSNVVLGVRPEQLNYNLDYPVSGIVANQLETWNYLSIFDEDIGNVEELPRQIDYTLTSEPLESRVKSYFAANCAMCHQPGGGTPTIMDFRWEKTIEEMNFVDVYPNRFDYGFDDPRIVEPGVPHESILLLRMQDDFEYYRMPPLGTSRIDNEAVAMIREWVESLGGGRDDLIGGLVYSLKRSWNRPSRRSPGFVIVEIIRSLPEINPFSET